MMIRLSTHRVKPDIADEVVRNSTLLFLDIDMAILGQPEFVYSEYRQNVRLEYAHVASLIFTYYRKKFVLAVLRHGAFHATSWYLRYI